MAITAKISIPTTPTPLTGEAAAQAAATAKEHSLFVSKYKADYQLANKRALASTATFAGFTPGELATSFGIQPAQAEALIARINGNTLSAQQQTALASLGSNLTGGGVNDIPWLLQHAAEHPKGSHYSGDFNIGSSGLRGLEAFGSGGFSELARSKPFQPGGSNGSFLQAVPGVGQIAGAKGAATKLTSSPGIPPPATPPPTPNQAAARAALDKADVERRKQLATSTGMTSVLGLPGEASVKRTVLG